MPLDRPDGPEIEGIMQDLAKKLTFSAPESFQLVMTGLKYLREYERKAQPNTLNRATETLAAGVRKFPRDIAPRFYLGVAKAVSGAKNSGEAITLLEELLKDIENYNNQDLRLAVKYNLASAHAGTYEPEGLRKARDLLDEVLKELPKEKTAPQTVLQRQVEIFLIWLDIRDVREQKLAIQKKRRQGAKLEQREIEELRRKIHAIAQDMEKFRHEFDGEGVAEHERNDVLADYWNNNGIISWYLAEVEESEERRRENGQKAIDSFRKSLQCKLDWPPPRSNMASVYHDILEDRTQAEEIWLSILDTEPSHAYAKLNLGYLAEEKAEEQKDPDKARAYWEEAVDWYRKAESRGAALRMAKVLLKNLQKTAEAKAVLDELLEKLDPGKPDDSRYRSEAYEIMGEVQERLGNVADAIAAYGKSDRPKALEALARLGGANPGSADSL
jgi:tetratricopeptide (TPR) repeat protein